jgi:hypothetical protein
MIVAHRHIPSAGAKLAGSRYRFSLLLVNTGRRA